MRRKQSSVLLSVLLGVAGCATAPMERVATQLSTGDQVVMIKMSGFTFRPDVVTLQAGMPIAITAVSNSRIPHNITILSLDGQPLKSVDIPANQTVAFEATLPQPGRYVFYCAKFLHRRPFGMEGTLVAK